MPKENVPIAAPKIADKPLNPYGRKHVPIKAGHVLMMQKGKSLIQSQFNVNDNHPFYRPIENLQTVDKENVQPSKTADKAPKGSSHKRSVPKKERTLDTDTEMTDAEKSIQVQKSIPKTASNADAPLAPRSPSKQNQPFSPSRLPKIGFSPNGTKMVSKRNVKIAITDLETKEKIEGALLFFSPDRIKGQKRKRSSDLDDASRKKALFPSNGSNAAIKGGKRVILEPHYRDRKKARSQKTIMKKTAREALLKAIADGKNKYEPAILEKLKLIAALASLEWLHCVAFRLAPKHFEPQHRNNLGVGPDYINTYMMVLEALALYFSNLYPKAVSVVPVFKMLGESDVIQEIEYEVSIQKEDKIFTFYNKVNAIALLDPSNWPSSSDSDQLKLVAEALVEDRSPSKRARIS